MNQTLESREVIRFNHGWFLIFWLFVQHSLESSSSSRRLTVRTPVPSRLLIELPHIKVAKVFFFHSSHPVKQTTLAEHFPKQAFPLHAPTFHWLSRVATTRTSHVQKWDKARFCHPVETYESASAINHLHAPTFLLLPLGRCDLLGWCHTDVTF